MPNGDKLLIETHGLVREMSGKLDGLETEIKDAKDGRKRLHDKFDHLEKEILPTLVKKEECQMIQGTITKDVERIVTKAINGRKRATGLIVKDIILGVLGTGGAGTVLILYLLGKLG